MPSAKLDLGKYVTLRGPRANGTFRVFFQVPARLRPSGWLSLIPLPIEGGRTGNLRDADEVGRIQKDAADLYIKLMAARLVGEAPVSIRRDFPALNRSWQGSDEFKTTRPRTQKGYVYHAGLIEDWSAANGHPPIARLGRDKVEAFLALFDDRPTTKRHVKIVLKMLLDRAVDLKWIAENPAARIKVKAPKSKVAIWEQSDVDHYAWASAVAGHPALAAMIVTGWEIGQRVTDLRMFRLGASYSDSEGAFRFYQSKTDSYVTIPVSEYCAGLISAARVPDALYLFINPDTGAPYEESRLGHLFQRIRRLAGGRNLTLRALRHSCVVQLARFECTIPEIASITGHSPASVEQILRLYLPRDNLVAWNAQAKRGLVRKSARTRDGQKSNGRVS